MTCQSPASPPTQAGSSTHLQHLLLHWAVSQGTVQFAHLIHAKCGINKLLWHLSQVKYLHIYWAFWRPWFDFESGTPGILTAWGKTVLQSPLDHHIRYVVTNSLSVWSDLVSTRYPETLDNMAKHGISPVISLRDWFGSPSITTPHHPILKNMQYSLLSTFPEDITLFVKNSSFFSLS